MPHDDPATPPARPYSPMRVHAGVAYTAGHVPLDRATGAVLGVTVHEQTLAVLDALESTLRAGAGVGLESVLTFTVYLTDVTTIDQVDAAFRQVLAEPYPARTTIGISALPRPSSSSRSAPSPPSDDRHRRLPRVRTRPATSEPDEPD